MLIGLYLQVRVFFARLDEELNKVNQFYKRQESEFVERGEILQKQLQILLDLKQILADRRRKNSPAKLSIPGIFPNSPAPDSDDSGQFSSSFFLLASQLTYIETLVLINYFKITKINNK